MRLRFLAARRGLPLLLLVLGFAACDASDPGPEIPGAPTSLDGIYMGFRTNAARSVYEDFFTFYPDGRVLRSIPSEGLDRPYPGFPACTYDVCGTYTRSDTEVRIVWGDTDAAEVYAIDADGALQKQGQSGKHRPTLALPAALDARYAVVDPDNGDVWVSLRLHADGRFEEEHLSDWTNWTLDPNYPERENQPAPDGGTGTYALRRNTLALHYTDGFTAYYSVVVPPGEAGRPVPESIYVNGGSIPRVP